MQSVAVATDTQNPRAERRNLFALATIRSGSIRSNVRMRNLSETGALIEGAEIPDIGSSVTLSKNGQSVDALVMWKEDAKAGLQFSSNIAVSDWFPGQKSTSIRLPAADRSSLSHRDTAKAVDHDAQIVDPVNLALLLEQLADRLSEDLTVGARHPDSLRTLDHVAQSLRAMANGTR